MARYLVTGGAGFIGSHIAETLAGRGEAVRVLDNLSTGKRENLAGFAESVEFLEGDIRDLETCRRAVEGVDYVLHQAALPSVPRSVEDPLLTNAINITGTLNMMLAARDAGVRSFVQASSSSVYGDDAAPAKVEGREGKPLSPYAVSKLVDEKYARVFYDLYGFRAVSLRYFNVFGPRQDPFSQYAAVIPLFITLVLRGERPVIYGDGEQSRDFTYIDNVVEGNILAATSGGGGGEAFNIACGDRLTVNGLLEAVNRVLGTGVRAVHAEPRPGDIRHSTADYAKARRIFGFEPCVPFLEGLRRTVDWYKNKGLTS
ncbi:MAG: SDR family oxidoreductase [Acidobacteria bacterium]|nr:SDR family oxidoreductase [Acidobacteriota bacterium]